MEGQTLVLPERGGGGRDEGGGEELRAFASVAERGAENDEGKRPLSVEKSQPDPPRTRSQGAGGGGSGCKKQQNKHFSRQQSNKGKKWKLNKFRRNQKESVGGVGKKKDQAKGLECGLSGTKAGDEKQNPLGANAEGKQQQGKSKHSNKNNNSLMQVRTKRLQSVSKFFLPDKRPRKDCIIPPTKFLLGGNISDPLNLNSLQNESENAVTPKSSPIPTPPHYKNKIEVIIPPNINDPLHLLDPVDSVEYEMQLCSPMKKKQRARNKRKRKSKSEKNNQSLDSSAGGNVGSQLGTSISETEATTAEEAQLEAPGSAVKNAEQSLEGGNTGDRDKATRCLRLDLEVCRKRRISESTSSSKNKVRRMDSMDKIVSPVVPQPGAWKRGHWPTMPVGGRNRTRTQSCTSNSDEPPLKQSVSEGETTVETPQSAEPELKVEDVVEPKPTTSEKETEPKPKPQEDSKYHYGNYDRYYGYRNLNEFIDVRLKVFLRNPYLFRDKDVLDIGCNVGLMTIAVAKMLHTKSITGIDIDEKLIAKARRNLTTHVRIHPGHAKFAGEAKLGAEKRKRRVSKKFSADEEKPAAKPEQEAPNEDKPGEDPPPVESTSKTEPPSSAAKKGQHPHPRRKFSGRHGHGKQHMHNHQHHHHQHHHHHHQQKKDPRKGRHSEFYPISFPLSMGNLGAKACLLDMAPKDHKFPNNVIFKTVSLNSFCLFHMNTPKTKF